MNLATAALSVLVTLAMLALMLGASALAVAALVRFFRHRSPPGGPPPGGRPPVVVPGPRPVVRPTAHALRPAGARPARARSPLSSSRSRGKPATPPDAEHALAWRYRQFMELGLDPAAAVELAASEVDLGEMRGLVDRGCPPPVAVRILR